MTDITSRQNLYSYSLSKIILSIRFQLQAADLITTDCI